MSNEVLLELQSVSELVPKHNGEDQKILNNIDFTLTEGEIVAILGKSGSGKSTLLRLIAGLEEPNFGTIKWHIKNDSKNFGMSMIFQSFALFPWLTVFENIELGLETMNLVEKNRRERIFEIINLIGLSGFESAYPKELSNGMKQRVGFARALVVRPEILLMDEPFSALDVLTSHTLKSDFLELWMKKKTQLKSVIMVTNSIEDAVLLADRVVILGSNPGHIVSELKITLPHPRNTQSNKFHEVISQIYTKLSESIPQVDKADTSDRLVHITQKLPHVYPNQVAAIVGAIVNQAQNGCASFASLAKILHLDFSTLLHISEALEMFKFATVEEGEIKLTKSGLSFANHNISERKKLFATLFIHNIPIISYICKVLQNNASHTASMKEFLELLEIKISAHDAMNILKTAIIWGRYSELFEYDAKNQRFSLSIKE